jgi:polyhydroxyalkanoate synthase
MASTALTRRDEGFRAATQTFDDQLHAAAGRMTGGLSTLGLGKAWYDWLGHMAISPGKQLALAQAAGELIQATWMGVERPETARDPRFRHPAWRSPPFSAYANGFVGLEQWWRDAFEVDGVTERHRRVCAFVMRQLLDVVSPSNFPATNPEVLGRSLEAGGRNFVEGARNAARDAAQVITGDGRPRARVGRDVAATPGRVVRRTQLAEIIQYDPTTEKVRPEPIVIVPAPIMKYYILDLTPQESLVRALVDQGFTVFMVSWKNPGAEERDLGFEAYGRQGFATALDAACEITGSARAHAVGYCLGGTLTAMMAAAMARDGDDRLASLSLLAAQADFTEAGELSLFINESQVALLEDVMRERGFLLPEQMSGVFHLLRDKDLIWSRAVRGYLMAEEHPATAMDDWSEDATRLPFRLEQENLRNLYLTNDLAEGRFRIGGRPVALRDIEADMFVLGTESDHIAPWRSVYKLHLLCEADITFALTDHGHNVGVVCPLDSPGRHYRLHHQASWEHYLDPGAWLDHAPVLSGSWWAGWFDWLHARSGPPVPPPARDAATALGAAPGQYVLGA